MNVNNNNLSITSSSGRRYNNEPAIISLTSWTARIHTAGLTIFSLLKNCPGFHIVLVLSEEEFPNKEHDLPVDLIALITNNQIEVLWIYKNVRSFKKWFWTYLKYPNIPIISADDDCIYTCNYAKKLYQKWLSNKISVVSCEPNKVFGWLDLPNGYASLYPPYQFTNVIDKLTPRIVNTNNDDVFIGYLCYLKHISIIYLNERVAYFHDEIEAMGATGKYSRGQDALNIIKTEYSDD